MKPKSILHPSFKYTCAAGTDLRKTFARVRREMKASSGTVVHNEKGKGHEKSKVDNGDWETVG